MPIHVEPLTQTVRWYERPGGFERWEPFAAVATLVHIGPGTILVAGMNGQMTRQFRRELEAWCVANGIVEVVRFRRGRRVVSRRRPDGTEFVTFHDMGAENSAESGESRGAVGA